MSGALWALMWAAVLLTPMAAAEVPLLRRTLIPQGDVTSVRFELMLILLTLIMLAMLAVLTGPIIGPGPKWEPDAGPSVPIA